MKTPISSLAALAAFLFVLLSHDAAFGADGCSNAPCLNGGTCSVINTWGYSCSCPADFLGPTCAYPGAGDELVTAGIYTWSGSAFSVGHINGDEESGYGQSFTTTKRGKLQKVSFDIYVKPEAVARPENLVVEVWNADESGEPTGSPLASRTLDASGFTPESGQIISVDFSAEQIELEPSTQYAFTVSVKHKAIEGEVLYYISGVYNPEDDFPAGEYLTRSNSGSWIVYGLNDWNVYQVTVVGPFFDDGFEVLSP